MRIRVRLFAVMAQDAGAGEVMAELPAGARVGAVEAWAKARWPGMRWPTGTLMAVNQEYAGAAQELREGDEVAVIPPVSGG